MLTPSQRQTLKAKAHHLKPVVRVGQKGLTEAVLEEVNIALNAHGLIKVHIDAEDKAARQEMADTIAQTHEATLIQIIGHTAIFHRPLPTA